MSDSRAGTPGPVPRRPGCGPGPARGQGQPDPSRPRAGCSSHRPRRQAPRRVTRTIALRPWPLASGGGPGRRPGLQCPVQGAGQRYLAVQSGQPEQLPGPGPGADYLQAGPVRGGTPGRADQRREPGRINEADLVKVDYQRAAAGCQLEKALAQAS